MPSAAARFNQMPIMMGTTHDEGNFTIGIAQYFKQGPRRADTRPIIDGYLQRIYGGNAGPGGSAARLCQGHGGRGAGALSGAKAGAQMAWDRRRIATCWPAAGSIRPRRWRRMRRSICICSTTAPRRPISPRCRAFSRWPITPPTSLMSSPAIMADRRRARRR